MKILATLGGIAALAACATVHETKPANSTAFRDEVIAADRAFAEKAHQSGTVEAFAATLADDATTMPDDKDFVHGNRSILTAMASASPDEHLDWVVENGEASADGTMGFTYGHWTLTAPAANGKKLTMHGKYVTIWRRRPGGPWRVVFDGGNTKDSKEQ